MGRINSVDLGEITKYRICQIQMPSAVLALLGTIPIKLAGFGSLDKLPGMNRMKRRLTAVVEHEGDGYVALCPDVDVVSQGATVAEARDNLIEAQTLFFEPDSASEIDGRLNGEVYITNIELAIG